MECEICKKMSTQKKTFYTCYKGSSTIELCDFHGNEFFLAGEQRFVEKYPILREKGQLKTSSDRILVKSDSLFG